VRIDLHTHSTASDGTMTPAEVVEAAVEAGLDVLALTDHDVADGWEEAARTARAVGQTFIPGMEISTKLDGAGVHLLAYLPDPSHPVLAAELTRILEGRSSRLPAMVAQLRRAGLDITAEEVRAGAIDAAALGRPHVADALVARGIVPDRAAAFREWLGWGRAGYVNRYAPPTYTMIELVIAAGGAPVIAHPWGRGSRRVLDLSTLASLAEAGLVGIEVDHQDHEPGEREALRGIAAELGLVVTGSSDFHGEGKVDHDLGCNTTAPDELDRLLTAAADNAAASGRNVPDVVRP
jgi:predicted metal-dependent phosphoesterase TrpH